MPLAPFALLLCALWLALPAVAPAQTEACRQVLMRNDDLRQLYARGDGVGLRVSRVPDWFRNLTSAHVHEVARRKLQAAGLYDPDAPQWLEIAVNLGSQQFNILMTLRRLVDDLGYGLPGESTVWGMGGGGTHEGSPGLVLVRVSRHMDEFIRQYGRAQRACTM